MSTNDNLTRASLVTGMVTGVAGLALAGTAFWQNQEDRRNGRKGGFGGGYGPGGFGGGGFASMNIVRQKAYDRVVDIFGKETADYIGGLLVGITHRHGQDVTDGISRNLAMGAGYELAGKALTEQNLLELCGSGSAEPADKRGPKTAFGKVAGYVRDVRREVAGRSEADEAEEAAQQRREAAEQRRLEARLAQMGQMFKIEADARKAQLDHEKEVAAIRNAPQARPNTVPAPAPSGPSPEVAAVLAANAQLTQQIARLMQTLAPAQPQRSPAGPPHVQAHSHQGAGQGQGATSP